jgi:hypothetical protein
MRVSGRGRSAADVGGGPVGGRGTSVDRPTVRVLPPRLRVGLLGDVGRPWTGPPLPFCRQGWGLGLLGDVGRPWRGPPLPFCRQGWGGPERRGHTAPNRPTANDLPSTPGGGPEHRGPTAPNRPPCRRARERAPVAQRSARPPGPASAETGEVGIAGDLAVIAAGPRVGPRPAPRRNANPPAVRQLSVQTPKTLTPAAAGCSPGSALRRRARSRRLPPVARHNQRSDAEDAHGGSRHDRDPRRPRDRARGEP